MPTSHTSHQTAGAEADDRRNSEAAAEQEAEVNTAERTEETITTARESYTRELAPKPEAAEAGELPSFDEAMDAVNEKIEGETPSERNFRLHKLAEKYSPMGLIRLRGIEGMGWGCEEREDSPLGESDSKKLAEAINDRIDTDEMEKKAKKNRVRNAKKNKERESGEKVDKYTELIEEAGNAQTLNDLTEIVAHCRRWELLEVSGDRRRWEVKGLKGNEASHKLAQAINSKKKKFMRVITDNRRRISNTLREIEYCPNSEQLDKDAQTHHDRKRIVKEITGSRPTDWVAHPIKGKQGSKEVAEALNKRREELIKSEEEEDRARLRTS